MPRSWTRSDVLDLMRSFQAVCVLGAAAELELFAVLQASPRTAADVAASVKGDLRATTMLLDALAALDVLVKDGSTYACAPGIAAALTPGTGSVLAMAQHQMNCLRRWADLAQVVRTGQPTPRRVSIRGEAGDRQSFITAMNDISGPAADAVVADVNVVPWTHLLDVGGASGTWTLAWLSANPAARATLFDLPPVIPLAQARLGGTPAASKVRLVGGDFERDELPPGADLAWVSAIIHQQGREENRGLYAKVFRALAPGGHIMIRDIVMDETRTRPPGGAFFAINMLSGTATGGTFTLGEIREDLESAGFISVKQIRDDQWMDSVVMAKKG